MIDWNEARLTALTVHQVGNRFNNQGYLAAKNPIELKDEDLLHSLESWFMRAFRKYDAHQLGASPGAQALFPVIKEYFEYPESNFVNCSAEIVRLLYEASVHPKIKTGDVFIAHFEQVMHEDELVSGLGIFKAEDKDHFLEVSHGTENGKLDIVSGWHLGKIDKAAVILNTMSDDGYRVYTSDMRGRDAQYWQERFLGLEPVTDNKYFTKTYMNVCREAIHDMTTLEQMSKLQEAQWLNRAGEYFEMGSRFEEEDFADKVFERPEHAMLFLEKKDARQASHVAEYAPEFNIHKEAVRELKRKFRNKILLDTNIELRILPNHDETDLGEKYIRKGFDEERQMHYYQVYFRKEL